MEGEPQCPQMRLIAASQFAGDGAGGGGGDGAGGDGVGGCVCVCEWVHRERKRGRVRRKVRDKSGAARSRVPLVEVAHTRATKRTAGGGVGAGGRGCSGGDGHTAPLHASCPLKFEISVQWNKSHAAALR